MQYFAYHDFRYHFHPSTPPSLHSERSSRRAHGQHLLRELRAQLRAPPPDAAGYLRSQLSALRTAGARQQALEAVLACRRLTSADMEAAVDAVLDAYTGHEPSALSHECQSLLQTAMAYRRLLSAYDVLERLEAAPPPYQQPEEDLSTTDLSELLRLSPTRTAELVSRLDPAPSPTSEGDGEPRARVTFAAERRAGPAAFLACLEVTAPHGQAAVSVKKSLTEEERRQLAALLFGACLSLPEAPDEWRAAVLRCGVPAAQLLRLLADCWLESGAPLRPQHLVGLAALLTTVAAQTADQPGSPAAGTGSSLWQEVQEQIAEAPALRRALALATVCRAVAIKMEEQRYAAALEKRFGKAAEAGEDVPVPSRSAAVSSDWEQLTEQTVSWDLLLHQLNDVTALCDVIPAAHRADVTLRALLTKGPGAVSELVARWLLEVGVEPADLAPPPPAAAPAQEAPPEDASEAAAAPAPDEPSVAEWGREAAEPTTEEGRRRQRIQVYELKAFGYNALEDDTLGSKIVSFMICEKLPTNFKLKLSSILQTDFPSTKQLMDNYNTVIKHTFLVDPAMNLEYEVPGIKSLVEHLQANGARLADSFFNDITSDTVGDFDCLLGSDIIGALKPLKTVDLALGTALEVRDGYILFGRVDSYFEDELQETAAGDKDKNWVSPLAARFPHSVRPDTLLLNLAWEEAAAWNRHREHTDRLRRAVAFAAHIGNAHLRYGACCLLWSAVLCRPCAALAGLLQRSGHRPDDALCRRELQLPQHQLPPLTDACSELLEQLLKALITSEVERPPVLYSDNLWTAAAGRADSLLALAVRQRPCSEELVSLHLQAVDVMRAQVHLDLRGVHPYGCFTEKDGGLLFGELSARYTPPPAVDQTVRCRREALLQRWVTAAVGLVTERPDGQAELAETALWERRCREAARGWDIAEDVVRRRYALDLYSAGHDLAAQEVLLGLTSAAGLPSQLLLLAGARVRHYIHSSSNMMPLLARLTMNCADFIEIANTPLQCPSVPLERTLALLRHVVRLQPDSASECRLALEMVDLVESLFSDAAKGSH
ncbi:Rab3 GTPase-activating protein non-catalytic subunit [Amphibalanus amphitrite]|uniref:Rab3 GTPase-activating protein non-catalytic subunit n=1 Tax=Amphibalanus amphitrite TaxID=1232801 RepID=A0A6A4VRW2_AMPAM|nr:Rab3 GTPase-activating protein non-catalytic subunit [Amphibalanus amphitrite]